MSRNPLVPYVTKIPPHLRQTVDSMVEGPARYPGVDEDDPGFVIRSPTPMHDPAAKAAAERLESDRKARAMPSQVLHWITGLSITVSRPPADDRIELYAARMVQAGRDLPAMVWSQDTLNDATAKFTFWPSGAELLAFLKTYADRLDAEIAALKEIAESKRTQDTIAVPSTKYLDDLLAAGGGVPPEREAYHFDPRTAPTRAQAPVRSIEEQLEALGFRRGPDGQPVPIGRKDGGVS